MVMIATIRQENNFYIASMLPLIVPPQWLLKSRMPHGCVTSLQQSFFDWRLSEMDCNSLSITEVSWCSVSRF